jgi:FMN phosphatase YigB (HAD superfamily)
MNYFIDFDCTLFDTDALTKAMLVCAAKNISNETGFEFETIYAEAESLFNVENIYNIFELCKFLSNKYSVNLLTLTNEIDSILNSCEKFVYDDSVEFLKTMKDRGHNLTLLTFAHNGSLDYQKQKVNGSGLTKYFDNIIFTTEPKWELDIDYKNSVFIDNNPNEVIGLYNTHPLGVIRVRRATDKYTLQDLPKELGVLEYKKIIDIIN